MKYSEEYDVEHSEQPNTLTFALFDKGEEITFWSADDKSLMFGANPYSERPVERHYAEKNAEQGGYFLRKGFLDAIKNADESVVTPIYIDSKGKTIENPLTREEALDGIYGGKMSIKGFRYNENATKEQREQAFAGILRSFVTTSNNSDFSAQNQRYIFRVGIASDEIGKPGKHIEYNNENPDIEMSTGEVMSRLEMNTTEALVYNKLCETRKKLSSYKGASNLGYTKP